MVTGCVRLTPRARTAPLLRWRLSGRVQNSPANQPRACLMIALSPGAQVPCATARPSTDPLGWSALASYKPLQPLTRLSPYATSLSRRSRKSGAGARRRRKLLILRRGSRTSIDQVHAVLCGGHLQRRSRACAGTKDATGVLPADSDVHQPQTRERGSSRPSQRRGPRVRRLPSCARMSPRSRAIVLNSGNWPPFPSGQHRFPGSAGQAGWSRC